MVASSDWDLEVFFDGDCPLCRREIALLARWDRRQRIRLTNIAAEGFAPAPLGVTHEQLMAEMHARLPDGTWVRGVEAFRRIYALVRFRFVVAVSRWPGISQMLEWGYRLFARNRLRLTGRCTDSCQIKRSE